MAIHSIHYRGIIYCNWLWCCDHPAASTMHLMIVFDYFYSIISNLLLPPFPITHLRNAYLCLNKRVKDIIELNCKQILAVLLLLWRELQGILIDCIPYCLCLYSNTPDMMSYHLSLYVQPGTSPHLVWQSDTRTMTTKGTYYPIPPCQIWITNPPRLLQQGYIISTPASSSLDYSTTQEQERL